MVVLSKYSLCQHGYLMSDLFIDSGFPTSMLMCLLLKLEQSCKLFVSSYTVLGLILQWKVTSKGYDHTDGKNCLNRCRLYSFSLHSVYVLTPSLTMQ